MIQPVAKSIATATSAIKIVPPIPNEKTDSLLSIEANANFNPSPVTLKLIGSEYVSFAPIEFAAAYEPKKIRNPKIFGCFCSSLVFARVTEKYTNPTKVRIASNSKTTISTSSFAIAAPDGSISRTPLSLSISRIVPISPSVCASAF